MSILIMIAVGIGFAAAAAFAVQLVMPATQSTTAEDRLSQMASRRRGGGNAADESSGSLLLSDDSINPNSLIEQLLDGMPALGEFLDQAEVKIQPSKFVMLVVGKFISGTALCIILPISNWFAPFIGLILAALPPLYVWMKRKQRLAKFGLQMPEALELLGRSLRAGHSLNAGFGLVGSEMEAPISVEFRRAFEEQNLGIPLDEAIEDMAARIPNMDLRFFATAVVLQRQTGGDLAEILDKIGRLIRERIQIQGQIAALTGEGRMSGIVLLGLPPVLFAVMLFLNYEYSMMLFNDEAGRMLLAGAIV
ncbi:MAG: type II secretion system F family protein, partial [Planctomycetota bacterium]